MTLGEGGAVNVVQSLKFKAIVESFRDWGRDCWCASGMDNTCGKRFEWQLGELPKGYDHKYIYSHFGYNLKPLDIQAAIGRVQLTKLPRFIQARIDNWNYLRRGLRDLETVFSISCCPPTPPAGRRTGFTGTIPAIAVCSWFGFMLRVKPGGPFSKFDFARHLDEKKIGNRMLFGGNLLRQPVMVQLKKTGPRLFASSATWKAPTRS
jgi:CDP-6-deoxy-D-xylo-4-hexulose-3-dehydrase